MSPAEPTRTERLEDALTLSLARMEREILPRDRVFLTQKCGACGASWVAGFQFEHSPYTGQVGAPLYRGLREAIKAAEALLERREPSIESEAWAEARRCECSGPVHLTHSSRVTLVRHLVGAGQSLAVTCYRGERSHELHRIPGRGPILPVADGDEICGVFGRPLSLFDRWEELELPSGRLEAEGGVWLWAGPSAAALSDRIAELSALIVVGIASDTVASGAWPASEALLAHIEGGGAAALTVERHSMMSALRRQAIAAGGEAEEAGVGRVTLRLATIPWTLMPHRIAREMARYGQPLSEACAAAVEGGLEGIRRALAFMDAVTHARPSVRFAIDRDRATPVLGDGSRGRAFSLERLPVSPDDPSFAREVAFLCDPLPEWADPTRTCPCGAPASVQIRIVPADAVELGASPQRPWTLRRWTAADGSESALEVVALVCDRHVRIEPRVTLEAAALTDEGLGARLREDENRALFAVHAEVVEDDRGARAILARGHLAASLTTNQRWLAGLNRALGDPLPRARAETWAFGPAGMCLLEASFDEARRDLLLRYARAAGGVKPGAPPYFALRGEVDLTGTPAGRFHFLGDQLT